MPLSITSETTIPRGRGGCQLIQGKSFGYQEPVNTLYALLLIAAAVCFGLAAFRIGEAWRVKLTPLGLFCWVLTLAIPALDRL
jgi:hypothetical protein